MFNHNKAQQSKNRVHISWDILYIIVGKHFDKPMTNGRSKFNMANDFKLNE